MLNMENQNIQINSSKINLSELRLPANYGATLGVSFLNVPITIGINWLVLVLATQAVVEEWNVGGKIGKAALGAGLMTALDVLIEPVAIHFDFWHWSGGQVPIQNFGAWWLASFYFHYGSFYFFLFKNSN